MKPLLTNPQQGVGWNVIDQLRHLVKTTCTGGLCHDMNLSDSRRERCKYIGICYDFVRRGAHHSSIAFSDGVHIRLRSIYHTPFCAYREERISCTYCTVIIGERRGRAESPKLGNTNQKVRNLLVAPRSESDEGCLRLDTCPYTLAKSRKRQC